LSSSSPLVDYSFGYQENGYSFGCSSCTAQAGRKLLPDLIQRIYLGQLHHSVLFKEINTLVVLNVYVYVEKLEKKKMSDLEG